MALGMGGREVEFFANVYRAGLCPISRLSLSHSVSSVDKDLIKNLLLLHKPVVP